MSHRMPAHLRPGRAAIATSLTARVLALRDMGLTAPEIAAAMLTTWQRVDSILANDAVSAARGKARHSSSRKCRRHMAAGARLPPRAPAASSFGEQCYRHRAALLRYANAIARNPEVAEDLVQDVFLRALLKQHRFAPGTDLLRWLLRLTHNRYVDHVRAEMRRGGQHGKLEVTELGGADLEATAIPSPQESMIERAEIAAALDMLPRETRHLVLRIAGGARYQDVADDMHIPIGTVRSRLSRGRRRLRAFANATCTG